MFNFFIILVCVGFFTLLERKFLSYINNRKGPNKVGFVGLLQPLRDGVKLFSNEIYLINKRNYYLYIYSPMIIMFVILIIWILVPIKVYLFSINYGVLIILCFLRLGVYSLIISGWSSNSSYSLIGAIRSVAQIISYEVTLILIIFNLIYLVERFIFYNFIEIQINYWIIFLIYFLALIFYVRILVELNRTPFDLVEGESELVSGFNVDYMRGLFGLIFISEYGIIIYHMYIYVLFYMGGDYFLIIYYIILLIILLLLVWVRGAFIRIRYDTLIILVWKKYLLISLNFIIFNIFFKNIFLI